MPYPGNIEKGLKWKGLADLQPDDRFAAFSTPEYGIRAICRLLRTYEKKYQIDTINGIVHRYAPPSENPSFAYASNVSKWSGFGLHDKLKLSDPAVLAALAKAICRQENGIVPWDDAKFLAGAELAFT